LTLSPGRLLTENPDRVWGFSALVCLDGEFITSSAITLIDQKLTFSLVLFTEYIMEDKFVDWDQEVMGKISNVSQREDISYCYQGLDASPMQTLSVAFFVYNREGGGRSYEVSLSSYDRREKVLLADF